MELTVHSEQIVQIGEERFDLSEYDFPTRGDSPDPKRVIEAIVECGGVLKAAAEQLPCSTSTLYNWVDRYDPIRVAVEDTRSAVACKARETLIELLDDADSRTRYKSAVKLLTMFHPSMDWSRRERREITRKEESEEEVQEELEAELEDASIDDLLDKYNEISDGN
jgi:transposase